ncbi:glycoside hydrolase family 43 protein [Cohnella rhizosphaerae]|uniref:Glycoside hydrolase family 43 protein n=1 Tax=Cohnella rhizosphaerae TaxID=1457232 RepID=A0A9X4KQI2_9BACL|nr:glycoside hydrolase family 43 protein [Cohnella rhizosphaerae]MDG0809284.1 glycoside hydrolase family 43 protein [Cohnella rhizosphaerae]
MTIESRGGAPLVTHIYTADPSAHVFEGKLYVYPSHDLDHEMTSNDNGDQYDMEDYHVLSLNEDLTQALDHGEALHLNDIPWAKKQLWAPDAAYKDGTYYLFFPARDYNDVFRIGVATGISPKGPFRAEPNYIPGSFSIDPAVFADDDGKAYVYFGGLWGGQLEKWQTGAFEPDAAGPSGDEPALGPRVAELTDDMLGFREKPREIRIVDEDGVPIRAGDEERRYFEGPWVHKHEGRYYLSYSTGTTHKIVYAVGDEPYGPFTFKGTILTPVVGWTTHHSIVRYRDKWYLFYHDSSLSGGADNKRCVKMTELHYEADGAIRTIDPYPEE